MQQASGFKDHVCRLNCAIYGLCQAPRAWYTDLSNFLLEFVFRKTLSDSALFVYNRNGMLLYFLVYADDLLLTGNNDQLLYVFRAALSNWFSLKSLGDVHYFLWIKFIPTDSSYLLSQHKYMKDVLQRFNMLDDASAPTPMASMTALSLSTQPDIALSVNKLSPFTHSPKASHLHCVKRLLRYVAGTLNHGLAIYRPSQPLTL
ncbi:unnamed protein product [Linum trigynum]|uniref:Reverse transcriptase Ty1/copia-type domain-containing protein n=1 Tax=Linum trigynum TaxID=586398 RepID=A0AAV2GP16_9ROSI